MCAVCVEFDLCLECFSAGVELRGHKYWHSYRVIEPLNFSFFTSDWSANEEQLLLEGLEVIFTVPPTVSVLTLLVVWHGQLAGCC